jgi:hypothetical protein
VFKPFVAPLRRRVITAFDLPAYYQQKTNPYPRAEDRGLVSEVFSSAAGLAVYHDPLALRPRIAPGLLLSENIFVFLNFADST